ncbi:MAG: helix-turn-helix domain-containing protein [Candidatus Caldarchaeales archaeon]
MSAQEDWTTRRSLVLAALLEGPVTAAEVADRTGLRRSEVESALISLEAAGLVASQEVKGFLRRRTVYSLTERGRNEAEAARRDLERVAEEIRRRAEEGDEEGVQELLTQYQALLPMLVSLHLLDLLMLQSLGFMLAEDQAFDYGPEGDIGEAEF